MSSSARILAAVSALALTAATAAPLAGAADNPAPKLLKGSPILFVDNEINPGTVAVAFRTDRPLDRKSNGKSIEGRAGVKGHSDSLSTFVKDRRPSYIAYVSGVSLARGGEHLKVGHRYKGDHQPGPPGGHAHRRAAEEHQGVGGQEAARLLSVHTLGGA